MFLLVLLFCCRLRRCFWFCCCTGKIGGGAAVSRIVFGMTGRESLAVGVLMNTRGLVELIILNIGLDGGVLTKVNPCLSPILLRDL